MHRTAVPVIKDSSDARFEQHGRDVGTERLIDNHLRNTSYDLSVSDHDVTYCMIQDRVLVSPRHGFFYGTFDIVQNCLINFVQVFKSFWIS
jgi:hypothetical protein